MCQRVHIVTSAHRLLKQHITGSAVGADPPDPPCCGIASGATCAPGGELATEAGPLLLLTSWGAAGVVGVAGPAAGGPLTGVTGGPATPPPGGGIIAIGAPPPAAAGVVTAAGFAAAAAACAGACAALST